MGPTLVATAAQPGRPPRAMLYDASSNKCGLVCMRRGWLDCYTFRGWPSWVSVSRIGSIWTRPLLSMRHSPANHLELCSSGPQTRNGAWCACGEGGWAAIHFVDGCVSPIGSIWTRPLLPLHHSPANHLELCSKVPVARYGAWYACGEGGWTAIHFVDGCVSPIGPYRPDPCCHCSTARPTTWSCALRCQ
jgi:hypothetical protein